MSCKSYDESLSSNDLFEREESKQMSSPFNYLSRSSSNLASNISLTRSVLPTNNVKVVCRFRPTTAEEKAAYDDNSVVYPSIHTVSVKSKDITNSFTFDRVFDPNSSQRDIYDYCIPETVDDLMNGYNGTILAYGQTGSGKSYTMMGKPEGDERGLASRIAEDIFDRIAHGSLEIEYTLAVSFFEIYMEHIKDLIDLSNNDNADHKFSIHEDKLNGIHVKGVAQAFVTTSEEMVLILNGGLKKRSTSSTFLNLESSRSHAIFQIDLSQKHSQTEVIKKSRLFLVDLAGSEKVDKTGAQGQTLEEAKKINSSLAALGNVINSLTDGKSTHIPYRDSKLTRILQESLGGNSRTLLIVNCSPSTTNELETLSTLRFGTRAKNIKNVAHVNTELSSASLKQKVSQLEKINENNMSYIKQLEAELADWRSGEKSPRGLQPPNSFLSKSMGSPDTPTKDKYHSRIPLPIATSPSKAKLLFNEEIARKDKKLQELENTILSMKMLNLKTSHTEESKLFSLENSLHKISNKLNDVELININLRKHLLISEKIIESRDLKINKLKNALKEQQLLISRETLGFRNKLADIQTKLEELNNKKHEELKLRRETLVWEMEKDKLKHKSNGSKDTEKDARILLVSGSETLAEKENLHEGFSINLSKKLHSPNTFTDRLPSLKTIQTADLDIMNFHQEYLSVSEFLSESRRRSNMIEAVINDAETSETSGMFDSSPSKSPTKGINLRIIKPIRGGALPNPINLFH